MGPDTFDCAGLVWFIYYLLLDINLFSNGYGISTTTRIMTNNLGKLIVFKERSIKNLNTIREGDILFFHRQSLLENEPKFDNYYPGHCGIYLGDNKFIQASYSKGKVVISNFDSNPYWIDVLVGSKDIIYDKALVLKKNNLYYDV